MGNELVLWNPQKSITIPPTAQTPQEIAKYAKQLTTREAKQVIQAFENSNYEMGSLFLWQKTMTGLKRQLGSLGLDFLGEMLDRPDITASSVASQVLTDHDALRLGEDLGMFTPTEAMRLRNVLHLVSHFSEPPAEEDDDDDRQMMPEEAIQCLRSCIQSVLGHERLEGALEFAKFRREFEEKSFRLDDTEIQSLKTSPYFFKRTTLRVLLALVKTAEGAQLQHSLENISLIVPLLWQELLKPDRWLIGRAYAEVHSEGRKTSASGLRKVLVSVKGFDYVPEDLRSRTFLSAADNLINVHFAMQNYYNEPAAIKQLASLGTVIPTPALSKCITSVLCVILGNHWGVCWAAQTSADGIISALGDGRWKYYLNECLAGDEIILEKLTDLNVAKRWCDLIEKYELGSIELSNKNAKNIIQYSAKKLIPSVMAHANTMLNRLTKNAG